MRSSSFLFSSCFSLYWRYVNIFSITSVKCIIRLAKEKKTNWRNMDCKIQNMSRVIDIDVLLVISFYFKDNAWTIFRSVFLGSRDIYNYKSAYSYINTHRNNHTHTFTSHWCTLIQADARTRNCIVSKLWRLLVFALYAVNCDAIYFISHFILL